MNPTPNQPADALREAITPIIGKYVRPDGPKSQAEIIALLCQALHASGLVAPAKVDEARADDMRVTVESQWSHEAKIVRQEKLTSALWGFAHDLQHSPHNAKCADGTTVNLEAVGRAQEIILAIFNQKPISIQ